MTMSLQELSDRYEIQDLLVTYSDAIDRRDWDALDDVFTPDAVIDYTAVGGIRGSLDRIKEFLATGLAGFESFQHLTSHARIDLDGDHATGRAICFNPMTLPGAPGGTAHTMFVGIWYLDRYERTARGWRIAERAEERSYVHNPPAGLEGL